MPIQPFPMTTFGSRLARRAWRPLAVAACVAASAGCVFDDFAELGEAIVPKSPSEAARMMLDPHNSDNRREGTVLISNSPFGDNDVYVTAYRDMVENDQDPVVRAAAIRALARHGTAADALLLAPHLDGEHEQVRWEAARGLQRLHNPEVIPALADTVRDDDEENDVRTAAAVALGQYPQDRAVQALIDALGARDLALNIAAQRSLVILTGQDHGLDPRAWLNWYDAAAEAGTAFAGGGEYEYPVYTRAETFWDHINIIRPRVYETPGPPAGLRPESERRTYEDDAPAAGDGA